MCMADDADGWKMSAETTRRARKEYRCAECRRVIARGESYERFSGLSLDGYWFDCKTCAHCVAVRSWLVVQCSAWLYEGVLEDLEEHWSESDLLRSRYLGRAILNMRRKWRKRNGELLPVPERFTTAMERAA